MKNKWQNDLQITVTENTVFSISYKSLNNDNLVWFQLMLSYRILNTKSYFSKLKILDSESCNHCGEKESLLHMFIKCSRVQDFWREVEKLIQEKMGLMLRFSKLEIIFGYLNKDQN